MSPWEKIVNAGLDAGNEAGRAGLEPQAEAIAIMEAALEQLASAAEQDAGEVDPDDPDFAGLREELAWHTARYLREYVLPPPPNQGSETR